MRPQLLITGYADENLKKYVLQTTYLEQPGERAEIDHISFTSLNALNKGIETCVAEAKENTYDYSICLVTPGVKLND